MRKVAVLLATLCGFVGLVRADDVVFAAARLKHLNGKYFPIDASHLYRVESDGNKLLQITFGDDSDTDPCVSVDGKRLLFWRRHRDGSVGNIRLISSAFDGSDQKLLNRFVDVDLSKPTDLARILASRFRVNLSREEQEGGGTEFLVKPKGKATPITGHIVNASPNGRFLQFSTKEQYADFLIDRRTGKTSDYDPSTWLGNDIRVSRGRADRPNVLQLESADGSSSREIEIHSVVHGAKVACGVFGGGWRSQDSDGRKAFWLGPNRENILLQSIWRSDTGGIPAVYCFNSKTGRTRFELADLFVEDVNSKRSHFLTTTWIWGRGWGADGAEPLRILAIWDADHVRSRRLGFDLAACHGACFVPTSPINPGHDSSHGYSGIAKKETHLRDSRILVFSARRYEQNLAKVYPLGSSHLYTVRLDGSGLRQITAGQGFDVFPSMSKDGKRVLFWRSRDPVYSWWIGSEMELYSVSLTGTDLRRMGQVADNTYRGSLVHTQRPSWIDVSHKTEEIIVSDRDGNVELTTDAYLYNPSGNRIIGAKYDRSPAEEGPPKHLIADQATHALAWVPAGYLAPVWIDDNLLVARVNGTKKFAILDSKGRELMRKEVRLNVEDQDSADPLADPEASFGRARRAFRLWSSRVFLMQDHHSLSTGGWDFVYRVDMNRGRAEFVCDQSIQGVSRDGFSFVGSEYRWVGAIKGPGAGWLGKMYLWDAKALTSKAIGFRLMETLGACFAKP